ncbi:hypothetical protein SH139x_004078 [Planctomycetaceae bacterium SH139]
MPPSKGRFAQLIVGILAGVTTIAVLNASSWYVLYFGWAMLALLFVASVMTRKRTASPHGEHLAIIGTPVYQVFSAAKTALIALGIFVILLGAGGIVAAFAEGNDPSGLTGGFFLLGAGVTCCAIPTANRQLMSAGYVLWAIAGALMIVLSVLWIDDNLQLARAITVGLALLVGGSFVAYKFLFGKTPVYEEGIMLGGKLVPWQALAGWEITPKTEGGSSLHVSLLHSPAALNAELSNEQAEQIQTILASKLGGPGESRCPPDSGAAVE